MSLLDIHDPTGGPQGQPLVGIPSTPGERFEASMATQFTPDRYFSDAPHTKWQTAIDALSTATGEKFENPYGAFTGKQFMEAGSRPLLIQARKQKIIDAHRTLQQAAGVSADLPNPELIDQQIGDESRAINQRAASLEGTGNGWAAFAGGALAPTPENIAGFFIPPGRAVLGAYAVGNTFLRTLGREMLYQAAANAGLTTAALGLDYPSKEAAGTAPTLGEAARDIAMAGAAGAVLGGAFHTVFHGPKELFRIWQGLPEDVRAKAPLEVKDAMNVMQADALYGGSNHFGFPMAVHDEAQSQALKDVLVGRAPNLEPIIAYHGSPYTFERFDSAHIGKGEGAQAFGHGLYFAENADVAQGYQNRLSGLAGHFTTPTGAADRALGMSDGDAERAIAYLEKNIAEIKNGAAAMEKKGRQAPAAFTDRIANEYEPAIKLIKEGYKRGGSLYEVAINADKNLFLDWDKPLSEQPLDVYDRLDNWARNQETHAQETVLHLLEDAADESHPNFNMKGADLYDILQAGLSENGESTSAALREAGIVGVRYLDQGSRGAGEGTRNFVVFPGNEHLIEIRKRNGEITPSELERINAERMVQNWAAAQAAEEAARAKAPKVEAAMQRPEIEKAAKDVLEGKSTLGQFRDVLAKELEQHDADIADAAAAMKCVGGKANG